VGCLPAPLLNLRACGKRIDGDTGYVRLPATWQISKTSHNNLPLAVGESQSPKSRSPRLVRQKTIEDAVSGLPRRCGQAQRQFNLGSIAKVRVWKRVG
jgi:hypothetical protein